MPDLSGAGREFGPAFEYAFRRLNMQAVKGGSNAKNNVVTRLRKPGCDGPADGARPDNQDPLRLNCSSRPGAFD